MAALWTKAPLALLRHPPLLAAILIATALTAAAAAAAPFVRAGVGAESLKGQVQAMSPLATGLEIQTAGSATTDLARRSAAVGLVRQFPFLGKPVLTTELPAFLSTEEGDKVPIVLMARTGAVAHVTHLAPGPGTGTWVSGAIAKPLHIKPGAVIRLARDRMADSLSATGTPFRVSGVYEALDGDLENDYWVNFLRDIRPGSIDAALPPSFVLVSEQALLRFARSQPVENRFEFPADPKHITVVGARDLDRRFAALEAEIARPGSAAAQRLGCRGARSCTTTTSLESALRASAADVASVSPVVSLVSGCAIAIGICLVFAVGAFLVARRAGEVAFLYTRGWDPLESTCRHASLSIL